MADSKRVGKVTKIMGGMFSGKSTEMLRMIKRLEYAGRQVQVFSPVADTRSPKNAVESRELGTREATQIETVWQILEFLDDNTTVIAIDEVQFLPEIDSFCQKTSSAGYDIIVSGLDYTFDGKPFRIDGFGCILDIPAEETVILKAVCMEEGCGEDAIFSERMVKSDSVRLVGSSELYRAVCRRHMGEFRAKTPTKLKGFKLSSE